ncbi:MAG TPA: hypothetical protein VFQ44_14720 [Streptosporangiaceae bacterium]|nr:hypothetical protein [Streptosporangiaceae bacterium]
MLLARLLPDTSHGVLRDGWTRSGYRPRHGRPPLAVRIGLSALAAASLVRERYLGAREQETVTGTLHVRAISI